MALTDQEILAQIAELSRQGPDPAKFMRSISSSKGSGKRQTTTQSQELDTAAFQKAKEDFAQGPIGQQITSLQGQLKNRNSYSDSLLGQMFGPAAYAGEIPGGMLAAATTPRAGGVNMAPIGTGPTGRAATLLPYAARAIPTLVTSYMTLRDSQDPSNSPAHNDAMRAVGTGLLGYGSYPSVVGLMNAYGTSGRSGIPPAPPPVSPTPPPPAPEPLLNLKGMNPKPASIALVAKAGGIPSDTLKGNIEQIKGGLLDRAPSSIRAGIAASHETFDPADLTGSVIKRLSLKGKLAVPLGLLGAGTALTAADDASAGPKRDESLTAYRLRQRLRQAGNLADTATAVFTPEFRPDLWPESPMAEGAGALGKVARSVFTESPASPVIDLPSPKPSMPSAFPNPTSRKGMKDAALYAPALAEDARQRAEMVPKPPAREPIGADAAKAVPKNAGVYDYRDIARGPVTPGVQPSAFAPPAALGYDPHDLPDYERGLLEKGVSPAEAAMHLMPHARAGAEAVKRGEPWEGGTDQYERERAALQGFYGTVNRDAQAAMGNAASPSADTGYARGGGINGFR